MTATYRPLDSASRFYSNAFRDYYISRTLDKPLHHRRCSPLPRFSTLRRERTSRPLSTSFIDTSSELDHLPFSYENSHLRRREIPLCTPDELLDIIRTPSGYYALPTDPWNEVYPGIFLSDAKSPSPLPSGYQPIRYPRVRVPNAQTWLYRARSREICSEKPSYYTQRRVPKTIVRFER
ncbi:hypothetical protein HNY73_012919 [Argiope bruennichi]|uniref:Uncharacterized protein n=1 Tax=Argiope bruennichi TaxID=94029 RepID=A0A8T0F169_ARGBR|nr:hypothetical protein HNY73_012919 [Argiope bruennichi]